MLVVMSDISERYRRLARGFADQISATPDDRWASPSPCEDWTALDVVRHVVDTQGMFLGFVGRELPPLPDVGEDPRGAWTTASAAVQEGLDDPERAAETFDGFFGTTSFEDAVDRFLNFDLVVHRWDLAHATGQDDRIDPDDVRRVRKAANRFGDAMRGPGAFGPAIDPPEDADEQAELLAFLGRRA